MRRAPRLGLGTLSKVAVEVKEVRGDRIWRRLKQCGQGGASEHPTREVRDGVLPDALLDTYRQAVQREAVRVLGGLDPPVSIVEPKEAEAIVVLSVTVKEVLGVTTSVLSFDRCRAEAEAEVTIRLTAELRKAGGVGAAESADVSGTEGFDQCDYIRESGDPDRLSECVTKSGEVAPFPFDRMLEVSRGKAVERVTWSLSRFLLPYNQIVNVAIFKLEKPAGSEAVVEQMKLGLFAVARDYFEKNAGAVRAAADMDSREKSHFLYDFGLCLMREWDLEKALAVIREAKRCFAEDEYETAIGECARLLKETAAEKKASPP